MIRPPNPDAQVNKGDRQRPLKVLPTLLLMNY
jgi:hypothetical protein